MITKTLHFCDACETETDKNRFVPIHLPTISKRVDVCPTCALRVEDLLQVTGLKESIRHETVYDLGDSRDFQFLETATDTTASETASARSDSTQS